MVITQLMVAERMKIKNYNLATNHINRLHTHGSISSLNYEHNAFPSQFMPRFWQATKQYLERLELCAFVAVLGGHETSVYEVSQVNNQSQH